MNSLGYDQSPVYASMEMSQETHSFVQLMSYNNYRKNVTSLSRGGEQRIKNQRNEAKTKLEWREMRQKDLRRGPVASLIGQQGEARL